MLWPHPSEGAEPRHASLVLGTLLPCSLTCAEWHGATQARHVSKRARSCSLHQGFHPPLSLQRSAVCPRRQLRHCSADHACLHLPPSPGKNELPTMSLQSCLLLSTASRKKALPASPREPGLRCQSSAAGSGSLAGLPQPPNPRTRGCRGVGKFKGHCAALCKFKYICTGSTGLHSWCSGQDKQGFLQELKTMGE